MQLFLTIILFCMALLGADLLFADGQITLRLIQIVHHAIG